MHATNVLQVQRNVDGREPEKQMKVAGKERQVVVEVPRR